MVDLTSVRFLLAALAGWLNHQQADAMAYVIEENRILRAYWGAIAGTDVFTTEVWTWRRLVTYAHRRGARVGFAIASDSVDS